jgi:hypothetical protein
MFKMLLQVYITSARELNVYTVTEQNGILLLLMNSKCCYLKCKKLLATSSHCRQPVPNYLSCSTSNNLPGDFSLL